MEDWTNYLPRNGNKRPAPSLPSGSLALDSLIELNGLGADALFGSFNSVIDLGPSKGGGYIRFDSPNKRIIVNDGIRDRVILNINGINIIDENGATVIASIGSVNGQNIIAGTVGTTQIANAAINNAKIANGAITNAKIGDAEITSAKINDLSADKINAGTLTGRTVQTASSGARVVVDGSNNRVSVYDSNRERIRINGDTIEFFDQNGNSAGTMQGFYSTDWGVPIIDFGSSFLTTLGDMACEVLNATDVLATNIEATGTKDFNIPHPTKEGHRLVYSCPESPEVLVMCRGKEGEQIPDHFYEISEPGTLQIIRDQSGNWFATAVRLGYKDKDCEPKDSSHPSQTRQVRYEDCAARQEKRRAEVQEKIATRELEPEITLE